MGWTQGCLQLCQSPVRFVLCMLLDLAGIFCNTCTACRLFLCRTVCTAPDDDLRKLKNLFQAIVRAVVAEIRIARTVHGKPKPYLVLSVPRPQLRELTRKSCIDPANVFIDPCSCFSDI